MRAASMVVSVLKLPGLFLISVLVYIQEREIVSYYVTGAANTLANNTILSTPWLPGKTSD